MIKLYQVYSLPYLYQELEPFIDTHTSGLHYQKHYKGYLNKLNELLKIVESKQFPPMKEIGH